MIELIFPGFQVKLTLEIPKQIYKNTEISAELISLMNYYFTKTFSANITVGSAITDKAESKIYVAIDFLFNK
jgi:hypothetical protein